MKFSGNKKIIKITVEFSFIKSYKGGITIN